MISFNIGGVLYKNITEATFTESMIDFTNEASFKIALQGSEESPFIIGEDCLVYVDGTLVMTGIIYDVNLSYDSSSHILNYIVRDITADFADSDIDVIDDLSGSLSLKKIIEKVLSSIGSDSKISVLEEYKGLPNFDLDNDKIDPEYAENAFDYIQGLARKRQVLLSTSPKGEIVIFRNSDETVEGKIQNSIKNTQDNNIISSDFSKRQSSLFNTYVVRSQLGSASSKSSYGSGVSNSDTTDQSGTYVDDNIRKGRQKCIIHEEASASGDVIDRAKWLHDFSEVESSNYSVTLQGHSIENKIFRSNTLIQVIDDFARISDYLLIKSVTCISSNTGGNTTALDLVNKNSFKVFDETQQKESERTEKDSIIGAKI
ncbi:MAG: hypothetical protein K0U78_15200 [Actinomycetia bacterium]|nr:hypothetical protein [Actinomycetes bacterium]